MTTITTLGEATPFIASLDNQPKVDSTIEKTKKQAEVIKSPLTTLGYANAIFKSKTFKIIAIATVGALIAAFSLSPLGLPFLVSGLAVTALALAVLLIVNRKEIIFEMAAIMRMTSLNVKTMNQIEDYPIYLGGLPNQISQDFSQMQANGIGAVLTVMEDWELKPMGLSVPYTHDQFKESFGEDSVKHIKFKDHKLLNIDAMDQAAEFIKTQIDDGKKVYVHCRGGVGRSATAIAAYLMKYENKSIDEVKKIIKDSRPSSTIKNKTEALINYQQFLEKRKSD